MLARSTLSRSVTMTLTRARSTSPSTPDSPSSSSSATAKPLEDGPSAAKRARLSNNVKPGKLPYDTGLHLAPMVRIGTLPTRLISLEYGASIIWGPEIVDRALIGTERVVDDKTGVVSFIKPPSPGQQAKPAVFTCHPLEKERLIFQIGTADPKLALEAATLVHRDVAGIGLNCGCPKPFSTLGGMGARLLDDPDRLCSILKALCTLPVPIDCKIRLLPDQAQTLALVSKILETPIQCLTVHCRTPAMRSSEAALLHRLGEVVDLVAGRVPVVANGDCFHADDLERICRETGVKSVMIARGAEANPSCFLPGSALKDSVKEVLPLYLRVAHAVDNTFSNSKYVIGASTMSGVSKRDKGELKNGLNKAKTYHEAASVLGVELDDNQKLEELVPNWVKRREAILAADSETLTPPAKEGEVVKAADSTS